VPLADQPRAAWDTALIAEGQALVRQCLRHNTPGPYQLQAAIQAVHSDAARTSDTDWSQIVALYDQLSRFVPGPVVALNRAVAIAEVQGPAAALALLDAQPLHEHHLYHAVRAELLSRLGETSDAVLAFDTAARLTQNARERQHLLQRRAALLSRPVKAESPS
jgi:RNA polymerase sigma-70 factor (ECF subfamily)